MTLPPPRLHVIPATGCQKALILRRGPSGQVLSLLWDRASGHIEAGQWLKGRIFEHRSDLSPDGRHFVYFAVNGQTWWTAVSRPPWLRAVGFYPQSDTWFGGGAFDAEGRLFLTNAPQATHMPDGVTPAPKDAFPTSTDGFHMGDLCVARLRLRGWSKVRGSGYDAVLSKPVSQDWALELSFAVASPSRSIVSYRYALVSMARQQRLDQPDWEWAEPFGDIMHVAREGCLMETDIDAGHVRGDFRMIKDFGDMTFEAIDAPYGGLSGKVEGL